MGMFFDSGLAAVRIGGTELDGAMISGFLAFSFIGIFVCKSFLLKALSLSLSVFNIINI